MLSFRCTNLVPVVSWVLEWGPHARVIEPKGRPATISHAPAAAALRLANMDRRPVCAGWRAPHGPVWKVQGIGGTSTRDALRSRQSSLPSESS